MNKKYIFMILFFFSFFLFGSTDVHAMKGTLSFDDNEHFNYFYEMKNNTSFYQFLNSQGRTLIYTLNSYRTINNFETNGYTISLYNKNEINSSREYQYAIGVRPGLTPLDYSSDIFEIELSGRYYIYYFDEYGNILDTSDTTIYNFMLDNDEFTSDELSYLLSKYYITSGNVSYSSDSNTTPDLFVNNFIIDGESYVFEESSNYSKFRNWFISKFGNHHMYEDDSLVDFIDYYSKNLVIGSSYNMHCLFDSLFGLSKSVILNGNYSTFDLKSNNDGFYLVPKNSDNVDYNIYYYSSSLASEIFLNTFDLVNDSLINNKDYTVFCPSKVYQLGILYNFNDLEDKNDTSIYDHIYHFSTTTSKYSTIVYYDPNAYEMYSGGNSFTFVNPNTNNTIGFDAVTQNNFVSQNHNSMQTEINKAQDYLDSLSPGFSFENALDSIKGIATTLSSSFTMIGSLITVMFASFPSIIQQFFLAIFVIGGLIILIKLLRG